MARTPEEMREYQRQRRARLRNPVEVPVISPVSERRVEEPARLPKRRGTLDGVRLGDGLMDTVLLVAQLDPAAKDAILEGLRLGSPVPWRTYLEGRK